MEEEKIAAGRQVVLLVDDEQEILDLYGATLRDAGLEVTTALNGAEALRIAKEKRPNLVLLDLKMPEMDGVEVLEKMRQDPEIKDIKVVFVSAFGDSNVTQSDSTAAKQFGVEDFIKKGLPLDEFVTRVKAYL